MSTAGRLGLMLGIGGSLMLGGAGLVGLAGGPTMLLGAGALAAALGGRHALDADHVVAIDGATRALARPDRRPVATGFAFSLGHATVVLVLAVAAAAAGETGTALLERSSPLRQIGGIAGSAVSGVFLLGIAALSLHGLRRTGSGRSPSPVGPIGRLAAPLTRRATASWRLYPIGLLFGLGLDTAAGVVALAASARDTVSPIAASAGLALLFAGAMCLLDTLDGWAMASAYRWGAGTARRRFDVAITLATALAASAIGAGELAGLAGASLPGPQAAADPAILGGAVALALLVGWAIAALVARRSAAPGRTV